MARFERRSFVTPQVAQTSDLTSLAQRLGQTRQLAGQAFSTIAPIAGERARRLGAGQAVQEFDEEGRPIAPELRSTFTAAGRGFNQAAIKGYQGAITNDIVETVSRIENESATEDEFNTKIVEVKSGLFTDIPPEFQSGFAALFDDMTLKARLRLNKGDIALQRSEDRENTLAGVESLQSELLKDVRGGDEIGALTKLQAMEDLLDGSELPESEATEMFNNARKAALAENETADVINFMKDGQLFKSAQELERLRLLKTPPGDLSQEEWEKHLDSVVAEASDITKARKEVRDVQAAAVEVERAGLLSDIITVAKAGEGSRQLFEKAFENGIIPSTAKFVDIDQINTKALQEKLKLQQDFDAVVNRINGDDSQVLEPKVVNDYYDQNIAGLDDAAKALFVGRVKMVPKGIIQEVDSKLLSGDRGLAVEASKLIDNIDQTPGMEDPFTPQTRSFASQIVKLSANLVPEEAVKLAAQLTDPRSRNRIESRQTEFEELQKGFNGKEFEVQNIVETGLFNFNVPPSELDKGNMEAEFVDLVESHFLAGMDIDAAEEKAGELVRRNWKEQTFMGKTSAFKYPLIDYYAVEGSVEYLEGQLAKDVSTLFFAEPPSTDEIFLLSDKRTADEAAFGIPTYLIYVQQDGLFTSTGQRFAPDLVAGQLARDKRLAKERQESAEAAAKLQTAAERQRAAGLSKLSELGFEAQ